MTTYFPLGHEKRRSGIDHIIVEGVRIESRYNVPEEYEAMTTAFNKMKDNLKYPHYLEEIFCDSKCGHSFILKFRKDMDPVFAWGVVYEFEKALSGHNGIQARAGDSAIQSKAFDDIYFDPRWNEDEEGLTTDMD